MSQPTKRFDLGDVLSISTGLLVSERHLDGVYDILNWTTEDNLFAHQLPRAMRQARPWLARWFPELPSGDETPEGYTEATWREWLAAQKAKHGAYRDVPRIPRDDQSHRDPLGEFAEMVDPDKIIVVVR